MSAVVAAYGLCQCGCGEKAAVAKQTVARLGHKKGHPARFVVGHNTRLDTG